MSGPGGSTTKRDQRRESRRAQYQQRQVERQHERARKLRNQRIRRASIAGGGILIFIAIIVGIVFAVTSHSGGGSSSNPVPLALAKPGHPATGQPVDGIPCQQETVNFHYHTYLQVYANGHPVNVPTGIGIVAPPGNGAFASNGNTACLYALHIHAGDPNMIHIESPTNQAYTFGQFFDIFGQPLSPTQFAGYTTDTTHQLVYEVFDQNGKLTKVTGDPRNIQFATHETIVVLYNSPNVKPKPYTNWGGE